MMKLKGTDIYRSPVTNKLIFKLIVDDDGGARKNIYVELEPEMAVDFNSKFSQATK
jgi:hypothetical protein